MRVLVDVDGVVADFTGRYLGCLYSVTGRRFSLANVTKWEHRDCLGISAEEDAAAIALVRKYLDFDEIPGAVDAVRRVASFASVAFVTAPHKAIPEWTWAREAWLERRFPGVPVVHTAAKHLVIGDVMVDDKFENLDAWLAAGGVSDRRGILFAAPYNADAPRHPRVLRTNDWAAIVRRIEDHAAFSSLDVVAQRRCP